MKKPVQVLLIFLALLLLGTAGFLAYGFSRGSFPESTATMTNVVVYEGLPHPAWEPDLLESEKKSKKTIKMGGFLFYEATLHPNPADLKIIVDSLRSPALYEKYKGPSACGGFHPDFAVTWENKGANFTALICFGCSEIDIDGTNYQGHFDLARYEEFQSVLKKSAVNRPPLQKIWPFK
jgi:hypothetical protein